MMTRTPSEIVARVKEVQPKDFIGFETTDLVARLSYAYAKEFVKDDVTREEWDKDYPINEDPIDAIKEYMSFAWEKANGCRGISAHRSLCHMRAWLWLAGEDEFLERVDLMDYDYYGKPQLRAICEHLDIDWKELDSGVWRDDEMSDGVEADKVARV